MCAKKNSGKKLTMVLVAIILVLCCTIGGTLAWLKDTTGTVTNTFTMGDVDIKITETGADESGKNDSYKIVPGKTEKKDPKVTVLADSEKSWVFVEIVESNNYIKNDETYTNGTYVNWSVDSAWKLLSRTPETNGAESVTYVYYLVQNATTSDVSHSVLSGDSVSYRSDLTKAQLDALGSNKPTLSFKAYAIQYEYLTKDNTPVTEAKAAWELAKVS